MELLNPMDQEKLILEMKKGPLEEKKCSFQSTCSPPPKTWRETCDNLVVLQGTHWQMFVPSACKVSIQNIEKRSPENGNCQSVSQKCQSIMCYLFHELWWRGYSSTTLPVSHKRTPGFVPPLFQTEQQSVLCDEWFAWNYHMLSRVFSDMWKSPRGSRWDMSPIKNDVEDC